VRGEEVATGIRKASPGAKVAVLRCDLMSLASVKDFCAAFRARGGGLDILFCNAGTLSASFCKSKDGLEQQARLAACFHLPQTSFNPLLRPSLCRRPAASPPQQFATNHLGHFLMARLLMEPLAESGRKSGEPARVVVLSSLGHLLVGGIPLATLHDGAGYDGLKWYGYSKLANVSRTGSGAAQRRRRRRRAPPRAAARRRRAAATAAASAQHAGCIHRSLAGAASALPVHRTPSYHARTAASAAAAQILMARELNARCAAAGLPVTAVCLHPGLIRTNLARGFTKTPPWVMNMLYALLRPAFKSKKQGAACQVYCATAKALAGGEYYDDCRIAASSSHAHDAVAGRALWEESERLIAQLCPC